MTGWIFRMFYYPFTSHQYCHLVKSYPTPCFHRKLHSLKHHLLYQSFPSSTPTPWQPMPLNPAFIISRETQQPTRWESGGLSLPWLLPQNALNWVTYKWYLFLSSGVWEAQDHSLSRFGVWWQPTSWFIDAVFFAVSSHGQRKKEALLAPFIRTIIPFIKAHPHNLITSQSPTSLYYCLRG